MRRNSRTSLHVVQLCAVLLAACGSKSSGTSGTDGAHPSSPSGPGDFSSVWQAASVEVTAVDPANPTAPPQQQTLAVPALVKEPTGGANIELYVTFDGGKRITYGRYENTNAYYRISQAANHAGDGSSEMYSTPAGVYTLEDGLLRLTTYRAADGKTSVAKTTFRKVDFPPAGWPTQKIDYEAGDSL